jgi:competence protein ComEA
VERDLPWRVLEVPEDSGSQSAEEARPAGGPHAGPQSDPRRVVALVALAISALIAVVVVAFLVLSGPRPSTLVLDGSAARTTVNDAETASPAPDTALVAGTGLVIDVTGAVLHPGVYHLPAGARVADAIAAAGGFGPRVDAAAAQALNLAAPLTDGLQVRVPSRDDAAGPKTQSDGNGAGASGGSQGNGASAGARVDLNTATSAELDGLPGIGPVTAGKIIASREQRPFTAVEDLQTRKLVGSSTFAKLAGLVTVGGK